MPPPLAQVDEIFVAAALAANQARLPLAKMAVEETRMGLVEDKVRAELQACRCLGVYNVKRTRCEYQVCVPFERCWAA